MSDQDPPSPVPETKKPKLMSDQFDEFCDDLELLYIPKNLSGRVQFTKKWPAAAAFIFGQQLLDYDQNGIKDRETLQELEEDAEIRRSVLLETFETIQDQSISQGSLRANFITSVVKDLGENFARNIYSKPIIDRALQSIAPKPPEPPTLEEKPRAPQTLPSPSNKLVDSQVTHSNTFAMSKNATNGISVTNPYATRQPIKENNALNDYVFESNADSSLSHLLDPELAPSPQTQKEKQKMTFVPSKKEAESKNAPNDSNSQLTSSEESTPQLDASLPHEDEHS